METASEQKNKIKNRENERGAALVTVLLISMLLLVAGSALLFAATLNTANVTDAVADQQAYYAAESGIQAALNIFRNDNNDSPDIKPSPLLDTSKLHTDVVNEINYRKAVSVATSNVAGDTAFPRLSRWLDYGSSDRITINAQTGQSFGLRISDPDNTTNSLSYKIDGGKVGGLVTYAYSSLVISYSPPPVAETTNLNVSTNAGSPAKFGSFTVSGASVALPTDGVRFEIIYKMTKPYEATKIIRGTITKPLATGNVIFTFDSGILELKGSLITINNLNANRQLISTSSTTEITGNVTAVEAQRLILRSTGYGPRGAQKQLEAIIRKNFFDGLSAPATLTLVGSSSNFHFEPGSSGAQDINGKDEVSSLKLPPIGVTNDTNLATVKSVIDAKRKPALDGEAVNVADEMPDWLYNATSLHSLLYTGTDNLYTVADQSGRVFNTTPTPAQGIGDWDTGKGITFIQGDATFNNNMYGGGLLICTGTLTFKGEFGFKGLIIVTGAGGFVRSGAGGAAGAGAGGTLRGNIIVAPYDKNNLGNSSVALSGFLSPQYDTSGGGSSAIVFNSDVSNNGLLGISNFVIGIAEK